MPANCLGRCPLLRGHKESSAVMSRKRQSRADTVFFAGACSGVAWPIISQIAADPSNHGYSCAGTR